MTMLESLKHWFDTHTEEEIMEAIAKITPPPKPKGWLSLDEYPLPTDLLSAFCEEDIKIKLKMQNGDVIEQRIPFGDPSIYTIRAKENGVTHWFNDEKAE